MPLLVSNGNETMILRVHFKRQSTLKSVIGMIYIFVIHTYNPFMRKYSFALKFNENVCLSRVLRKSSRLWKKICLKISIVWLNSMQIVRFLMFFNVLFERDVAYGWGIFAHFYELWKEKTALCWALSIWIWFRNAFLFHFI